MYSEQGITVEDTYDPDIQMKISSTGDLNPDEYDPGTYYIEYNACNEASKCCTITRTILVEDTTAPELRVLGGDMVFMEASLYITDADSDASDACPPYEFHPCVSCDNDVDLMGYNCDGCGQDNDCIETCASADLCAENCISFTSYAIPYQIFNAAGWIESEYWVAVYGDEANEFVYFCGDETTDADNTNTFAASNQNLTQFAETCGAYLVTYSITDKAGNTGTATQTLWIIDTTAPTIHVSSYYSEVIHAFEGLGAMLGAVGVMSGVAIMALLANKRASRAGYSKIPV